MRARIVTLATAAAVAAAVAWGWIVLPGSGEVMTVPSPSRDSKGNLPPELEADGYLAPSEAEALKEAFGLPDGATQLDVIEALTNEQRAVRVANEVERYARARAPRMLGGIYLRNIGPIVFVRVGFTEALETHARALRRLVTHPELVRVYRAAHPRWRLNALQRDVRFDYWEARGIRITSVGVNEAASVVEIGVQDLTEEKRAALEAAYGVALIRVTDQDPFVALPG